MKLTKGTPKERVQKILDEKVWRTVDEIAFYCEISVPEVRKVLADLPHLFRFTARGEEYTHPSVVKGVLN